MHVIANTFFFVNFTFLLNFVLIYTISYNSLIRYKNNFTFLFYFFVLLSMFVFVLNFQTTQVVDLLFFIMYVLVAPISFYLLINNDKATTIVCYFNFIFLFIIVCVMINTKDLVSLVICYELLFLSSFFIFRKTIYSSSAESAYSVFTVWSVLGSLLVVIAVILFLTKNDLNVSYEDFNILTINEKSLILYLFIFGFGVKAPIWPFHYWLTRVHVEASTGFSIFLSGFLVKSAIYVCWKVLSIINYSNDVNLTLIQVFCLISIIDSVLKLHVQTDIKKQVAFATVFEMGIIFFFLITNTYNNVYFVFLFSFSHAFLSGIMFYLVELVYKRYKTRSLDIINNTALKAPLLSKYIWLMLFIFWGLPFTLKFNVEFYFILTAYSLLSSVVFFILIFVIFLANIAVTRSWFSVLYGSLICKNNTVQDITLQEKLTLLYLLLPNFIASIFLF